MLAECRKKCLYLRPKNHKLLVNQHFVHILVKTYNLFSRFYICCFFHRKSLRITQKPKLQQVGEGFVHVTFQVRPINDSCTDPHTSGSPRIPPKFLQFFIIIIISPFGFAGNQLIQRTPGETDRPESFDLSRLYSPPGPAGIIRTGDFLKRIHESKPPSTILRRVLQSLGAKS